MNFRVTLHHGKTGRNGVFNAKHNDRDFDYINDSHIDNSKVKYNRMRKLYKASSPDLSFDDYEHELYEKLFGDSIEKRNARHRAKGRNNKIKTVEEYRKSEKTCPNETLLYFGRKDECLSPDEHWELVNEFIQWHNQKFPNLPYVDYAMHVDERGAVHTHARQIAWTTNKNGEKEFNLTGALKNCGIDAPVPIGGYLNGKKVRNYTRDNNPKMTYTAICREKMQEIVIAHGYDLVTDLLPSEQTGLTQEQYIKNEICQLNAKLDDLRAEKEKVEEIIVESKKIEIRASETLKIANKKMEHADSYAESVMNEADEYAEITKNNADEYAKQIKQSVRGTAVVAAAAEQQRNGVQQSARKKAVMEKLAMHMPGE